MQANKLYNSSTILGIVVILGLALGMSPIFWSLRSDRLQQDERQKWEESRESGNRCRLVIGKLGVDAIVVEEHSEKDLDRGPMHLGGTPYPGQAGNCCIAAHKEKWFRHLSDLKMGDTFQIDTSGGTFIYKVSSRKIVRSDDVAALDDTFGSTVSLITCTGPAYFGRGRGRLIVVGTLKEARAED